MYITPSTVYINNVCMSPVLRTRQSCTGILLFCNKAPIIWFIKRQNLLEASIFGSDFTAVKTSVDITEAFCYKLSMFGVPIDVPTEIFCDNR